MPGCLRVAVNVSRRRAGAAGGRAGKRSGAGFRERHRIIRQIDDEDLADGLAMGRPDEPLTGKGIPLPRAVWAAIARGADPRFLERLRDLLTAGPRRVVERRDEHRERRAVVVPRMSRGHPHGLAAHADPHSTQVGLRTLAAGRGGRHCRVERCVFVRKTHEAAVAAEGVHVAATPQRAGRERCQEVAGVEMFDDTRPGALHDNALPVGRAVLPVGRGVLGPENEHAAVIDGARRHHAAARAVPGCIEHLDTASRRFDPLDPHTVEDRAVSTGPRVVDDPPRVGRPRKRVGQHVAVRCGRELLLAHPWIISCP